MPMAFLPRWGRTDNEVFPFNAPPKGGRKEERKGVKELPADIYIFVQGEVLVEVISYCVNDFQGSKHQ